MQSIYYEHAYYKFYYERENNNSFGMYAFDKYRRYFLVDKHFIFLYHLKTIDSRR